MPRSRTVRLLAATALGAGLAAGGAMAQDTTDADAEPATAAAMTADPWLWLEDVEGEKALDWVRARNAVTEAELASTAEFQQLESDILAILDSEAKIPYVQKIGDYYYNFWKDAQHERGIWRRTTLEEFRKADPEWDTIIDLDALNAAEGENWVWHGADCLRPEYERCLVALSRGGADADVTREFDLETQTWVEDGFFRPEAKGGLSWLDRDTVYISTDFGPGSMTESGYPRTARIWKRGTPMSEATLVIEGEPTDVAVSAGRDHSPGFVRDFAFRSIAFYNYEGFLVRPDGTLDKIDVQNSANKSIHREWLGLELREPWTVGDTTYPAGAFLITNFDDFMAGGRDFEVLFEPTPSTSLSGVTFTRNHVVLNVLDDVKNRLWVMTPGDGGDWTRSAFVGAPEIGKVSVSAVDPDESDAVWVMAESYLTPDTLSLATIGEQPEMLKTLPSFFDASTHEMSQHFATSKDGTRIPYFMVAPKDLPLDSSTPTLLYGYGGFEISMLPSYSATVGKAWLSKGGVYVVANIRGGGEYGPRWHQAALKANRHKAYEDFAAVARDLVERKVTSPAHLGIQGGSNGGLLMGNMLTQYPELFGAIVVQVPLLDMKRYHKLLAGASWMAEYGDPDKPEEWEFIQTFSPYHLYNPVRDYPPTLFTTSTRDDRVHPGHARKMMAKMLEGGEDVRYYENIEGGHGGSANNKQAAHMSALAFAFLWNQLAEE